jgi:hypothetical protein
MRRIALILGLLALGCGGGDDTTADANADARGGDDTAADNDMPVGIALADVAGTWNITATLLTEDTTIITYSVIARDTDEQPDPSEPSWLLNLDEPTREHIVIRIVSVDGDSIVGVAGPFESVLREDVMVTIRTVFRLQGDMLVGTLDATYDTDPVQTVPGTFEGTRAMP